MSTVNRATFMAAVAKWSVINNPVHTCRRSVMEHFNADGELVGSAEYIENKDEVCTVIYRLKEEYINE